MKCDEILSIIKVGEMPRSFSSSSSAVKISSHFMSIYSYSALKRVFLSKFYPQAAQGHLALGEGHIRPAHGDGHGPVLISRQHPGKLLPPVPGLVELHGHGAAHELLIVAGPLQRPLRAGGGYLQGVAALDGVRLRVEF